MLYNVTKENYQTEVLNSDKPVLIDFWAEWCGPCRMLSPSVEAIAEERTDIKVCKVNVDEQPELTDSFGINSIPVLFIIKNGNAVANLVGYNSKTIVEGFIDKNI
jgi:thioredoxin 1